VNLLRRLPLSRLLLLCGLTVAVGVSATAIALGVSSGPTPPAKPLADAVHDALSAPPVSGVSARIQLTDHLVEGSSLAGQAGGGGGGASIASNPLLTGASGRLWIAADGRVRMELQSEQGDSQITYDGHTVQMYDASSNTVYRYTVPAQEQGAPAGDHAHHEVPSVARIEEAITHISKDATLSGATPTDVAGQAAYAVRISPSHDGGLIGGGELAWDAGTGAPLRAAVYSTQSTSPVLELAATEISYGPLPDSTIELSIPASPKVTEITPQGESSSGGAGQSSSPSSSPSGSGSDHGGTPPKVAYHGKGLGGIAVVESQTKQGASSSSPSLPEGLQKVQINGATATELPTALGTLLSFERSGVRYLLAGSVTPAAIEAYARGL